MKLLFTGLVLWLGCTVAAWAESSPAWLSEGEVLHYRVVWGPLNMGKASLTYNPTPEGGYVVEAAVKDSSMWIDLKDNWRTEGVRTKGEWKPRVYIAKQQENDYRADKRVTFKGKSALYENLLSSEPSQTAVLPEGAVDILSTLYRLRARGLEGLKQPRRIPVMGLKDVFPLEIATAVLETNTVIAPKGMKLWRIEMVARSIRQGKKDKHWKVWLAEDGMLTPVRIETALPMGTFTAILRNDTERTVAESN